MANHGSRKRQCRQVRSSSLGRLKIMQAEVRVRTQQAAELERRFVKVPGFPGFDKSSKGARS
jgi:hypothetical protein